MANYTDEPVPFGLRLDPASYGMKSDRFDVSDLTLDGMVRLGSAAGAVDRKILLPAAAIKVVEIAPAGR